MKRQATVRDLLTIVEEVAPARLTEEWDNCGMMVGDAMRKITKVALALDPSAGSVEAAHNCGAQVLLTHHPLIFKPLKKIDYNNPVGGTIARSIRLGVDVVSAHTNLDAAENGVSRALAELLELEHINVLLPAEEDDSYKLTVFVPIGYENKIREALFDIGVGLIGDYSNCSFSVRGEGTFRPSEKSHPFKGSRNELETAAESRIEFVIKKGLLKRSLAALKDAHPYEVPAYDLYNLAPTIANTGFGHIGLLKRELYIKELAELINQKLELTALKIACPPSSPVKRVAILPGSGGGFLDAAHKNGAQVYITGDISYHQARDAENLGLCIIDAGHWNTEKPVLRKFAETLAVEAEKHNLDIGFEILKTENDPWTFIWREEG